MGAYKYIAETLQRQYKERDDAFKAKVRAWRAGPAIERVERPSNIARARRLGYQAKQGYVVVRARVDKGRRTRRKPMGGRKHKNFYRFVQPQLSHRAIAEQRVNRLFRNLEVLNSYWVGEDGNYKFFEVILADPAKPSVNVSSAIRQGKAFRGLTAAGNSRTPSRKYRLNKKLRRKDARSHAFSAVPYVKKEAPAAAVPKAVRKRPAKAAPKAKAGEPHAHAAAPAHAHKPPHEHAKPHEHKK